MRIAVDRAGRRRLRRQRPQRRMVLGAPAHEPRPRRRPPRPLQRGRDAAGDAPHRRRGAGRRRTPRHRLRRREGRLSPRRHAPSHTWTACGPTSTPPDRGGSARRTSGCSTTTRPPPGSRWPASSAPRTRPIAPRSTRRSSCAGSPKRSNEQASPSTRTPRPTSIEPHRVRTPHGTITADIVVRATEGFTAQFAHSRRDLVPIYSLMIATEPLPDDVWASIGWTGRETLNDARRMVIYGQRTADGRIAFGGRGAPYHFGSAVRPEFDRDPRVHALLHETLRDAVPRQLPAPASPTGGAARSARRATGTARSASIGRRAWHPPAATWATASPPPTSQDGRSPI